MLTLKLICIIGRRWTSELHMSVVMKELTSGILKHCNVLYFSLDMPTFDMRNEQKSIFHLKNSSSCFYLGNIESSIYFLNYLVWDFHIGNVKNFICNVWISVYRFQYVTYRDFIFHIGKSVPKYLYVKSELHILCPQNHKIFLYEICRIPYSNISENPHLSSVRYTCFHTSIRKICTEISTRESYRITYFHSWKPVLIF